MKKKLVKTTLHLFGSTNAIASKVKSAVGRLKVSQYDLNQFMEFGAEEVLLNLDQDVNHVILYSWGVLNAQRLIEQDKQTTWNSVYLNFILPARLLERLNRSNVRFKFIYISSESAVKGSYDAVYAMSKAAMERFIREIRINECGSSCLGLAPSMVEDCGMTVRRVDQENVRRAADEHPKKRLLYAEEIAELVSWLILGGTDYLTNTTIELNGGKFSRMIYK